MSSKPMVLLQKPQDGGSSSSLSARQSLKSTSSSNDGSLDISTSHIPKTSSAQTPGVGLNLMTPAMTTSSTLSRARSVPFASAASANSPCATSEATATGSFDATAPTTHYTVVATDCRRTMMSGNHYSSLMQRRGSGLSCSGSSGCVTTAAASSSFGSFGGNDADQEDNVEDEDLELRGRHHRQLNNFDEEDEEKAAYAGDDEADVDEIELRVKRQREALIRLREESIQKDDQQAAESSNDRNLQPPAVKRHHLSVKSAKAKSAKTHIVPPQSSSQQRHRQLQFLRHVHSAQTRLNAVKALEDNINEAGEEEEEDEDDEDGKEDSIGGLGRQIRKLSSRTLEFCDSIDELSASKSKACIKAPSPSSFNRINNQQPSIEVTQPDEKMQREHSNIRPNSYVSDMESEFSQHHQGGAMVSSTDNNTAAEHHHFPIHSLGASSASKTSNIQHGTSNAFFKNSARFQQPLNSQAQADLLQQPPPPRQKHGFGETLSNFASSLMGSRLRLSKSQDKSGKNAHHTTRQNYPASTDSRSSSTERPLDAPAAPRTALNDNHGTPSTGGEPSRNGRTRNVFCRQDTPRFGSDNQERFYQGRQSSTINVPAWSSLGNASDHFSRSLGAYPNQAQSLESKFDHFTPPSISIECPADDYPQDMGYMRLRSGSPMRSPSTDSTPRGFSSLDTDRDVDTPVMDEFAQFVNASIHPPNELSVPRCYPEVFSPPHTPTRNTLNAPSTAPNSRRPSGSSRASLCAPVNRNSRSLSLGYSSSGGRGHPNASRSFSKSSGGSSLASPHSPSRPQLRRESAQDLGDGEEGPGRMRIFLPSNNQPPDLKIDLLSETSSQASNSPYSPMSKTSESASNGRNGLVLLGAPGDVSGLRRHSHNVRAPHLRNKSAPVTPLNRSSTNVNAPGSSSRMPRSSSRDTYLSVPANRGGRERGTSLPEQQGRSGGHHDSDLYRLREFTVSNKRIISHTESLQPRGRSNNSINSSASSLTFSHSGRSSLRSSTEDDERESSRNSSVCAPRYTVLMLGASEVGKSTLTSQFMSSNDVGTYNSYPIVEEEYGEKCVNILLDGEEAELVFIDHPFSEISVENALATYMPDAMVIVYSVVDSNSLREAEEILQYLWRTASSNDKAVIVVGNKTDLVRTRVVPIVEAKAVASSFDCKYTETSGALNHNVDELLVGILKQIRLKLAEKARFSSGGRRRFRGGGLAVPGSGSKNPVTRRKSAGVRVRGILGKMLGGDSKSKSCDDLHVL